MKMEEMVLAGAALLALWIVTRGKAVAASGSSGVAGAAAAVKKTQEIFEADGTTFDNAWRYYDDGTSISPEGVYYFQGKEIWRPS